MDRDWRKPGKLPWGWWLRAGQGVLVDEEGRTWSSVRDAFFQGELGFPEVHYAQEQHELLLRVLTAIDCRWRDVAGRRHDIFCGDWLFWRYYMCWLGSIGMLERSSTAVGQVSPLEAGLSREGRSVMMMLQSTREPAWEGLPMAEVIRAVASSGRGAAGEQRERALQDFERGIGLRRHVFARERVVDSHLVTLTGMVGGPGVRMPLRRVTWSVSFTDEGARDDLFAWFATHVDRWDDWGEMAHRKGAVAFGQHLLGLIVASRMSGAVS